MKKWFLFGAIFALVLVLAACGGNKSNNEANNGAANNGASNNAGSGAASTNVAVKAKNWQFDQKEYHIPKGTDVAISLESTEGVHGIEIKGTDYTVKNGSTTTVNIADAGEYEMACNVPCGTGHSQMKTKLIVK
ncbi:cupredoxin domain-containing protein [Paenibacillus protaetiae]|nr:cupredoxin domain-containing protein [Paenibacillus protaetiae]